MNFRPIFAFAILATILARPAFAQNGTQPPSAVPPSNSTSVSLCHFDSNDGLVHPEVKPRDQVNEDELGTGVATEGQDTKPDERLLCQQAATATPTPGIVEVDAQKATATPTAPATLSVPSPTATATDAPTSPPAATATATAPPTATPQPRQPEPTWVPGPLPPCTPGGPEPCGGK